MRSRTQDIKKGTVVKFQVARADTQFFLPLVGAVFRLRSIASRPFLSSEIKSITSFELGRLFATIFFIEASSRRLFVPVKVPGVS